MEYTTYREHEKLPRKRKRKQTRGARLCLQHSALCRRDNSTGAFGGKTRRDVKTLMLSTCDDTPEATVRVRETPLSRSRSFAARSVFSRVWVLFAYIIGFWSVCALCASWDLFVLMMVDGGANGTTKRMRNIAINLRCGVCVWSRSGLERHTTDIHFARVMDFYRHMPTMLLLNARDGIR